MLGLAALFVVVSLFAPFAAHAASRPPADDVITDFGPSFGIWVWVNDGTWVQLCVLSPEAMMTGDMDGNSTGTT